MSAEVGQSRRSVPRLSASGLDRRSRHGSKGRSLTVVVLMLPRRSRARMAKARSTAGEGIRTLDI